jgi:hypothetical protein
MPLLIHGLESVLLQVVADRRRTAADALPDLLQGEAFGEVTL